MVLAMSRNRRRINLPAPYLKRIWLDKSRVPDASAYPFCLPLFRSEFEFAFEQSITIIVGENGTGKSTLLEGSHRWPATMMPAAAKASVAVPLSTG
jgi:predicted ATPase